MLYFLLFTLFVSWSDAALHQFFVGSVGSSSIYVFELDDMARTLTEVRNEAAQGVSPSISFDRSKKFLYSTSPSEGKLSRYSVGSDFSLKHAGTADIPKSCNTTSFANIKIASDNRNPNLIYGSASTGACSALFSVSVSGVGILQSEEVAGDVRSFAWSPDGRHLHALDSSSSSLLNFNMADADPNLKELLDTRVIANTAAARQVITHPVGHRLYVVTGNTNELIDIPLLSNDRINGTMAANRTAILVKGTPDGQYVTTSVAISSSNSTLWTLSRTGDMSSTFIVTVFRLDAATGAVQARIARASFTNYIDDGTRATSVLVPAPFEGDMVAVTTFPGGMVAVLGLVGESIKAYGRALSQDEGCCGEGVWLN